MRALALLWLLATFSAYANITVLGVTPNKFEPGYTIQTRFSVANDDGFGEGSVWLDGEMRCQARIVGDEFRCAWMIPHGGWLRYQVRYRRSSGEQLQANAELYSAGLELMRIQPSDPELGRAALFFSKLEIQNTQVRAAPTGFVAVLRNGVEICRSVLPEPSHCDAQLNTRGIAQYAARYSGDANYPALQSAPVSMLTRAPGAANNIYASALPVLQSAPIEANFFNNADASISPWGS